MTGENGTNMVRGICTCGVHLKSRTVSINLNKRAIGLLGLEMEGGSRDGGWAGKEKMGLV